MTTQPGCHASNDADASQSIRLRTRDHVARRLIKFRDAMSPLRTGQVPRPADAPRGRAFGKNTHHLLLLGAGPATGWGVTTHELALPGALARTVSNRTKRGCTVDLVTDKDMTAATVLAATEGRDLTKYDAILVTLGVNDALMLTPPSTWKRGMSNLLQALIKITSAETEIVVVGIQPIRSIPTFNTPFHTPAEQRALLLNEVTARLCAETHRTTFVSLPAPEPASGAGDRHRTPLQYQFWANCLALPLVAILATHPELDDRRQVQLRRSSPKAELARQNAVAQLDLVGVAADKQLRRIAALAQRAFNAETAMITVIGQDRQWNLTQDGKTLQEVDRADSFCDFAIKGNEVMIVRDTHEDERFRDSPLVTGGRQIRFYAGFPIDTPFGERIGTLCVIDSHPRRRADDIDVTLLRKLGHLVQQKMEHHFSPPTVKLRPYRELRQG